jgi:hypothetical protein
MHLSTNSEFSLKQYASFMLLFCLLVKPSVAAAVSLEDVLVYKNARVEVQQSPPIKTHRVVLSAPKRINNAPSIERELQVEGEKKILLTRLGDNESIIDAYSYYADLIEQNGSLEFSCEKRACGINSYWANSILDERRLAARDSDQYYLAGKVEIAGAQYWLSVFLVTNALKQNMVHIAFIRYENLGQHWENGYLILPGNRLPESVVKELSNRMQQDSASVLYVAAYASFDPQEPLSSISNRLSVSVQSLKTELVQSLAVAEERVAYHFVGPFHSVPVSENTLWFRLFLVKP